jgi:hypothetical protein
VRRGTNSKAGAASRLGVWMCTTSAPRASRIARVNQRHESGWESMPPATFARNTRTPSSTSERASSRVKATTVTSSPCATAAVASS